MVRPVYENPTTEHKSHPMRLVAILPGLVTDSSAEAQAGAVELLHRGEYVPIRLGRGSCTSGQ